MEKTFTYRVYLYLDGFWSLIRMCQGIDVNQMRGLVRLAIRSGYTYSSVHRAYIRRNQDGDLTSIARFTQED